MDLHLVVPVCLHSQYQGLKESDNTVEWYWKLVESLKEEEKALLLKFVTGSPCVPAGGFAYLQVLELVYSEPLNKNILGQTIFY